MISCSKGVARDGRIRHYTIAYKYVNYCRIVYCISRLLKHQPINEFACDKYVLNDV